MIAEGIKIERIPKGKDLYARINLRIYGEQLKDFFLANGIKIDDQFIPIDQQLQEAAKEVRLHKQGKLKLESAREFINDISKV